jgi:hypothetical protein
MIVGDKYANLQRCCGGRITTETLRVFRLAVVEHEAYSEKLRLWMNGEIDPQTGRPAEAPPLPADLLHEQSPA